MHTDTTPAAASTGFSELADPDRSAEAIKVILPHHVYPQGIKITDTGKTVRIDLPAFRHSTPDEWRNTKSNFEATRPLGPAEPSVKVHLGFGFLVVTDVEDAKYNDETRELSFIAPGSQDFAVTFNRLIQLLLLAYLR